ncbi:ribonuclease H-like domain-containing protein [Patescibacteria group bacterium]|nr:ribonuclease H-like domain-containing protein [Patescibacteria group bacterium]MDE1946354.1 ribonuclease H-like domain-containing protein [Patescibacteria group bacterium]MDE2010806.1 ribonuclease H-like domain-containing protein [Patescibacteria group bacterium]MDE2233261.1 ribonuclease H-like domain-containing protein [Patescibacteria group bacterium]
MRKITFDLETKNSFQDVGSNDPADLDLSVICAHDSEDDQYKHYFENELGNLWPILEQADILITWNGEHFDLPILNKYYPGDLGKIKHVDMMKEVQRSLGRRLKLDTVAAATLGENKSGSGMDAIVWWNNGETDKVVKYCIDDVRITKELYKYALANNSLKYRDNGTIKEVKLDTSHWEVPVHSMMTFTLPF